MEHINQIRYSPLRASLWDWCIYTSSIYVAPHVSPFTSYPSIRHIRPFLDLQTFFSWTTSSEFRYAPCYYHKFTMLTASQLLLLERQPATPRRTSVIAPVFTSYTFVRPSPIRIYTVSVPRELLVDLFLLPDSHGFTDFTNWPRVFIALHPSTSFIYFKHGADSHSIT